jgi:hypothetical protein
MPASLSPWRWAIALVLLATFVPASFVAAQSGGLKSGGDTGSLQLYLYDCPPGTDPTVDSSDCQPTDVPWNLWVAPENAQLGDERWLLEDAVEIDHAAYRFNDLAPGTWDFSPDQDGPTGPVEIVITGDPTTRPGLWQVEIEAGGEAVASVYRMLPAGYAETGDVAIHLMTCDAGTAPLVDDRTCDTASEPWDVSLELVGQSDVQTWTVAEQGVAQPDGTWLLAGLPLATLTVVSANEVDETDIFVGGDAYPLGNVMVVDVVAGEPATVILYQVPIA